MTTALNPDPDYSSHIDTSSPNAIRTKASIDETLGILDNQIAKTLDGIIAGGNELEPDLLHMFRLYAKKLGTYVELAKINSPHLDNVKSTVQKDYNEMNFYRQCVLYLPSGNPVKEKCVKLFDHYVKLRNILMGQDDNFQ